MTREQFNNLKSGDCLLMCSGRVREVLKVTKCSNHWVQLKPRTSITLKKVGGKGTTTYVIGDMKDKIVGVFRIK
jgi:hypothetical protein